MDGGALGRAGGEAELRFDAELAVVPQFGREPVGAAFHDEERFAWFGLERRRLGRIMPHEIGAHQTAFHRNDNRDSRSIGSVNCTQNFDIYVRSKARVR
jgi:hypothetical protein